LDILVLEHVQMRTLLFATLFSAACLTTAWAQVPTPQLPPQFAGASQQQPPTKKTKDGICYAPSTRQYARIKDFIPFVGLTDCLKSGGRLPPR
jgi:hypothetical protein